MFGPFTITISHPMRPPLVRSGGNEPRHDWQTPSSVSCFIFALCWVSWMFVNLRSEGPELEHVIRAWLHVRGQSWLSSGRKGGRALNVKKKHTYLWSLAQLSLYFLMSWDTQNAVCVGFGFIKFNTQAAVNKYFWRQWILKYMVWCVARTEAQ